MERGEDREQRDDQRGRFAAQGEKMQPAHIGRFEMADQQQRDAAHIARCIGDIDQESGIGGSADRRDHAVEQHCVERRIGKIEARAGEGHPRDRSDQPGMKGKRRQAEQQRARQDHAVHRQQRAAIVAHQHQQSERGEDEQRDRYLACRKHRRFAAMAERRP